MADIVRNDKVVSNFQLVADIVRNDKVDSNFQLVADIFRNDNKVVSNFQLVADIVYNYSDTICCCFFLKSIRNNKVNCEHAITSK